MKQDVLMALGGLAMLLLLTYAIGQALKGLA